METVLEEPYLLLCDQKLDVASELVPLLEKLVRLSHRNLVVIADDISGEALTTLVLNKLWGAFNLGGYQSTRLWRSAAGDAAGYGHSDQGDGHNLGNRPAARVGHSGRPGLLR
jgi:hypothetical protein